MLLIYILCSILANKNLLQCVTCAFQETYESSSCYRYGDQVHAGRVTATLLDTELGGRKENLLVLICGTKTFEADMIDHLNTLGLSEDKYFRF